MRRTVAAAILLTACDNDPDMRTKNGPPGSGDTSVGDSAQDTETDTHDSDTSGGTDSNPDTGHTDTAPDECANAEELCGMDLTVRLREEWGASITGQNLSVGYDWSRASEVAEGIASGYYPPVPDFPDVSTYPDAYNDATDILNSEYGWGWCCSVLDWAAEYHTPQFVTVHHTAGSFGTCDEYVQWVFNYHAMGQDHGWGDAGYQFLVCEESPGNVVLYEGRFSGDTSPSRDPFSSIWVIGAHVGDHNTGNVGVSLVGDFSSIAPNADQFEFYSQVIARVFYETQLDDPETELYGHRDWGSGTECPGEEFYALLPEMTDRVEWCQQTCGITQRGMRARRSHTASEHNVTVTPSLHESAGDEYDMVGTCPVNTADE